MNSQNTGSAPDESRGPLVMELSGGQKITVYPMSYRLFEALQERFQIPDVPVLEVPTMDGGTEKVESPKHPPHLAEVARIEKEKAEAFFDLMVMQCLSDVEVPEEPLWVPIIQLAMPGYVVPEDTLKRKKDYLEYVLIRSRQDWELLNGAVVMLMAVDPAEVDAQMRRFRSEISGQVGLAIADAFSAGFLQPEAGADDDSEGVGGDLEGVPEAAQGGADGDGGAPAGGAHG